MFAHPRPGVTDTSAIPHDQVNNPGTINALINISQRPTFPGEQITKWRKAENVRQREGRRQMLVRARARRQVLGAQHAHAMTRRPSLSPATARARRCSSHSERRRGQHRRAGGDSARVLQHRLMLRAVLGQSPYRPAAIDPQQRSYGQTPFDIGQCRRDCRELPRDRGPPVEHPRFFSVGRRRCQDLSVARENERKAESQRRDLYAHRT